MATPRMLIQACIDQNLVVHQLDVKMAYLNTPIDFEIYVEQPEQTVYTERKMAEWELHKSIYGLKQSRRNWSFVLNDYLCENGFVQSEADPYLFITHKPKDIVFDCFCFGLGR